VPDGAGRFVTLPGHDEIRAGCMTLVRVRELIQAVVALRREAGDAQLHYVDGLTLFGAADAGDLPDDLHPNPAGYRRMGERFARRVFSDDGLGLD
jgi:lysophospholipase L1-like esterase